MRTDEHAADSTHTNHNTLKKIEALKKIEDIGDIFAKALLKIGIDEPADLAQYTPSELSKALSQKAQLKVSSKRIANNNWIGQARDMTQKANTNTSTGKSGVKGPPAVTANHSSRRETKFHFEVEFERVIDEIGKQLWETTAYDAFKGGAVKPFEKYKDFESIETTEWVNWILYRMRQHTSTDLARTEIEGTSDPIPSEAKADASSVLKAEDDTRIEVCDVQISECNVPIGVWATRLMAKIHFQLSGSAARILTANRAPFRIEVHAVNRESKASNLLVSRQSQLKPGNQDCSIEQTFLVPEIGRYRFHVIVLLLPPWEMMATYRSDPFDIVPYRRTLNQLNTPQHRQRPHPTTGAGDPVA
jgi:hypothetical protein